MLYGLYVTLFVPGILNERTRIVLSIFSSFPPQNEITVWRCMFVAAANWKRAFSQFLPPLPTTSLPDLAIALRLKLRLFTDLPDQPFYYSHIKELGHKCMQMNLIWHKLTTFSGAPGFRLVRHSYSCRLTNRLSERNNLAADAMLLLCDPRRIKTLHAFILPFR